MRVYLAAPYRRREELRGYRLELLRGSWNARTGQADENKVTVTSRWLDGDHLLTEEQAASNPDAGRPFAEDDVSDVRSADLLVLFTEAPRDAHRGGMHVEWGLAAALGKMLAIVGPRMNVFHTLEGVKHFDGAGSWPRAVGAWSACRDWILGGCK